MQGFSSEVYYDDDSGEDEGEVKFDSMSWKMCWFVE